MMDTHTAVSSEIAERDRDIRAWAYLPTGTPMGTCDSGNDGPLQGLRFGVKDVIDVRGMPTCHGAALTHTPPARFDAACVAMLRSAGAQPVGKTVTAEFAVTAPGPTRNPWNLLHTPGGSSSGSAAAVAAGMVPMAIGTQTGGSIIRPAAFNGVVGFKPSFGRVPRTGMHVLSDSLDTIGWFTSDVALARRVAEVFMAELNASSDAPKLKAVSTLNVAVMPCLEAGSLSPAAMQTLKQSAEDIANRGAQIEWLEEGDLVIDALALHGKIMAYEVARGLLPVFRDEPSAVRPQTAAFIEQGLSITPTEYHEFQQQRVALSQAWRQRLAEFDLVLTPSAPGAAPEGHATTGSSVFNRVWSLLGWPSIQLPISQTDSGLPLGVQCVGRPDGDIELLDLAEAVHPLIDRRRSVRPG